MRVYLLTGQVKKSIKIDTTIAKLAESSLSSLLHLVSLMEKQMGDKVLVS